jgi:hypothetical protein
VLEFGGHGEWLEIMGGGDWRSWEGWKVTVVRWLLIWGIGVEWSLLVKREIVVELKWNEEYEGRLLVL